MARPTKKIDEKLFKSLCQYQCTLKEIAGIFGVSEDTIQRFCKRTYKKPFIDCFNDFRQAGLISLRRTQFKLAEKSPAMAIFLGKQYLGQKDVTDDKIIDKIEMLSDVPTPIKGSNSNGED